MTKPTQTLRAIAELATKDVDAATDEEIWNEFVDQGEDPAVAARRVRQAIDDAVALRMRERAKAAKDRMRAARSLRSRARPSIEAIKARIQQVFSLDPNLAAAFRDGKRQSDSDVESLYDDLVEMGKIRPDSDGD